MVAQGQTRPKQNPNIPPGHRCVDDCANGEHVICEHTQRLMRSPGISEHIGVGVYEDGTVDVAVSHTHFRTTLATWREANEMVEKLAKSAGLA